MLISCTNKAFSSMSTNFNVYVGWYKIRRKELAKIGIKSCKYARESIICIFVYIIVTVTAKTIHVIIFHITLDK